MIGFALLFFSSYMMIRNCGIDKKVIFWDRLLYVPSIFLPVLIYHFVLEFIKKKKPKILWFGYLISSIFLIISRTDYFLKDVFHYKWGCHTVAQTGHHIWLVFFLTYIFLTLLTLFSFYKKADKPLEKIQAKYLLVAFFVLSFASVEFLPAYKIGVYPFGYFGWILFALIIAYIITQHRLFVKVLATNILIVAILIFLLTFLIIPGLELTFLVKLSFFLLIAVLSILLFKYTNQEAKRREEAERLAAEFKHLNEAKTQFIMATQHHMRTPLTIMKGYASMMLEGDYGKVRLLSISECMSEQSSIERLITLINEFLDISQFRVGKSVLRLENIKIEDLIKEIIKELKSEVDNKGLYLKLEKPGHLPFIQVDVEKLRGAIYNIIDNGVKYTEKGGVTISLKIENYKLKIAIHDTGIGMKEEEINTLFEETFERSEGAKKLYALGRGIGLYIASNIIKAHRGKIWAESPGQNKGSTFYIELPSDSEGGRRK